MKIAIQDSWPNLPENAEKEFIQRFHIACGHLGIECHTVVTSRDIIAVDPDFVLASHEFSRKLTPYPTIGLIWSPTQFFESDPFRLKSLLSYDGFTAANERTRRWLKDHVFGVSTEKPISDDIFLPTTYKSDIKAKTTAERINSAAYIGVGWDGGRHFDLFKELAGRGSTTFFGPPASWTHVGDRYAGFLPFDGRSVLETLSKHTAVLCLHKDEHRAENTPSMRIFEACSVGAIPICDTIAFARDNLADIALFVDMSQSPAMVADQIEAHLEWIAANPKAAGEMARRGQRWFQENWSLEAKIEKVILPLYERVLKAGSFEKAPRKAVSASTGSVSKSQAVREPACEVVIRTGGRELSYLKTAIASVRAASTPEVPIHVVVADYKGRSDVETLCKKSESGEFRVKYVRTPDTGYRSTALWGGLRACTAPYVAHLDDDDTVFPNHYRQLIEALATSPRSNVSYSGVVLIQDEPGHYFKFPNHSGPKEEVIEEDRDLKFLDAFDLVRLSKFDNFIQSNTWLARREYLHEVMGDDPELVVVEDVYLYLLMASTGPFRFTGSATALWHWRSQSDGDNSMFSVPQDVWMDHVTRIKRRLSRIPFDFTALPAVLAETPVATWETVSHRPVATLKYESKVEVDRDFVTNFLCAGFHALDGGSGLWSREPTATITLNLSAEVAERGGVLLVNYGGSVAPDVTDRWVQLTLSSGAALRSAITDWGSKVAALEIPAGTNRKLTLSVTSSHFVNPSLWGATDERDLGAHIADIGLVRNSEFVPRPSTDVLVPGGMVEVPELGAYGLLKAGRGRKAFVADGEGMIIIGAGSTLFAAHFQPGKPLLLIDQVRSANWYLASTAGHARLPSGQVTLTLVDVEPDAAVSARWSRFDTMIEGGVHSHFADASGGYEHASFLVARSATTHEESADQFFLFQRMGQEFFWEVRPSYGLSWGIMAPLGERSSDDWGVSSRGRVGPVGRAVRNKLNVEAPEADPWISDAARELLESSVYGLVRAALFSEATDLKRLSLSILRRMID